MSNFNEINKLLEEVLNKLTELENITKKSITRQEKIEEAYWKFDNSRLKKSERDAFKQVVAELIYDLS